MSEMHIEQQVFQQGSFFDQTFAELEPSPYSFASHLRMKMESTVTKMADLGDSRHVISRAGSNE